MNTEKNIVKNYLYNVSYQVLAILAPLITTPYISRVLGPDNIGIYSFTTCIVSYFSLFLILGLHLYGQREIAYNQHNKHIQTIRFFEVQGFKLCTTVLMSIVYFLFVAVYGKYRFVLVVQGLTLLANFFDISWFYQGLEEFKITVLRNFIVKILGIVLILSLIKNEDQLILYVVINVSIVFLGNVSLWSYLPKRLDKIEFKEINIRRNIKMIIELFLPLIAVQVYYVLDKTMLGILNNGSMLESGFYEQTTKISNLCMVLITSVSTVILPRMAAEYASHNIENIKKTISRALHYVSLISCPICIGLIAVSDSIIPWFLGNGYEPVGSLLKLYSFVILIVPISNLVGNGVLTPIGKHNKGTLAVVCGALVNLVFNTLFIKSYGASGATVATIIAESVVAIMQIYYSREYINLKLLLVDEFKFLICSILMYFVVLLLSKTAIVMMLPTFFQTVILIITGMIVYIFEVVVLIKDEIALSTIVFLTQKITHKEIGNGNN